MDKTSNNPCHSVHAAEGMSLLWKLRLFYWSQCKAPKCVFPPRIPLLPQGLLGHVAHVASCWHHVWSRSGAFLAPGPTQSWPPSTSLSKREHPEWGICHLLNSMGIPSFALPPTGGKGEMHMFVLYFPGTIGMTQTARP